MSICSCLWLCNCLWLCSRLCYDYVDDIYFIYCHWKESEFLLHHMSTCMRTVQKVMDLNFPHEKKIKHMRYLLEGRCMAPSSGMCKFSPTCKKHQSLVVSLHCQRAVESYQIFICHKITQLLEQQYCIRFLPKALWCPIWNHLADSTNFCWQCHKHHVIRKCYNHLKDDQT